MIKIENRKIYLFFIYPLAALIFLVLSVAFILSAKGYNIHLEKNEIKIEKTGMLIIGSKPSGADILLNGKDTTKKTTTFFSVKIDGLGDKKYLLTLEKDGYYKWEKEVKIFPEMVTWANYVLLFPKKPNIQKIDFDGTLIQSFPSLDSKANLTLIKTQNGEAIYQIQNSTGEKSLILDTGKQSEDKKISGISIVDWSKDRRNILVSANLKSEKKYWVVNTDSKNIEDLTALSPIKFDVLKFSTANNDELFGLVGGVLSRVNIKTRSVTSDMEKQIVYFTFSENGKIYYIKDEKGIRSLWQAGGDLSGKTNLSDAIPVSAAYNLKIDPKDQKVLVQTKENAEVFLLTKVGEKNSLTTIGKNVSYFAWSADSERFLYKIKDSNIIVFESDDFKKESMEYNILGSQNYGNIIWYDSRHLLAKKDDNKLEIMDFDGANRVTLGEMVPDRLPFSSSDNGDILFFSPGKADQAVLDRYITGF